MTHNTPGDQLNQIKTQLLVLSAQQKILILESVELLKQLALNMEKMNKLLAPEKIEELIPEKKDEGQETAKAM